MNTNKQKITVGKLREWLISPPQGMTITYVSGKNKSYSWGSQVDKFLDEELSLMTDRQHVTVTLENTLELMNYENKVKRERELEAQEQTRLKSIFKPTNKKVEVAQNDLANNVYTTWIDEVNGIARTDWNGVTGKYIKL